VDGSDGQATLAFNQLAVSGPMGCEASLTAMCTDAAGRSNTSASHLAVYVDTWSMQWVTLSLDQFLVPVGLAPLQPVTVSLNAHNMVDTSGSAGIIECTAMLSSTSISLPLPKPLRTYVSTALDYVITTANESSSSSSSDATNTFYGLSLEGASLYSTIYLLAECLWTTTQQLIDTLTLPVNTVNPRILLHGPTSRNVQGYTTQMVNYSITGLVGVIPQSELPYTACSMISLSSSGTTVQLQVLDTVQVTVSDNTLSVSYAIEGAAGSWMVVAVSCSIWNGVIKSTGVNVSLLPFHVQPLAVPREYVPSDVNTAWPVRPNVVVRVSDAALQPVVDAACSLSAVSTVAGIGLFSKQALSNVRANTSGHVAFPTVSVRGDYQAGDLQLKVSCTRDSGDTTLL
jgi:hypothetical protein